MKHVFRYSLFCLFLLACFLPALQAQNSTISTTTGTFISNSTSGMVTFNFSNNNPYPVSIREIESVSALSGYNTAYLYYNQTPINGTPLGITSSNGWNVAMVGSFLGVANTSNFNTTTQSFISTSSFVVPANTTYGFVLTTLNNSAIRVHSIPSSIPIYFSAGGCTISTGTNISYGTSNTPPFAPASAQVGFVGKIMFVPVPVGLNNAGIIGIEEPLQQCGPGLRNVKVRVANFGKNRIDSFNLSWTVDGLPQPNLLVKIPLDTILNPNGNKTDTLINLGQYFFKPSQNSKIRITVSLPNGQLDPNYLNDTMELSKRPLFTGNYTVGGVGADYQSLAEMATDMSQVGICGPVNIQVNPGTYRGKVFLNKVPGVSPVNTIKINGVDKNTCIVNDSIGDALVTVLHTGYVSIRNISVVNRFVGNCTGISIIGNTSDTKGTGCSIVNCKVNLLYNDQVNSCILVSGSALTTVDNRIDSITIDSNEIIGGLYGIWIQGFTNGNGTYNRNHRVRFNTINNSFNSGIAVHYVYNPLVISGNTISMNPSVITSGQGIYLFYNVNTHLTEGTLVSNNKILFAPANGINLSNCASNANAPFRIVNNTVNRMGYTSSNGILINSSTAGTYHVLHNTIQISAFGSQQYCFFYSNSANINGLLCKNNIFSILSNTGTNVYCVYLSSSPTINVINNNLYWNSRTANLLYRGGNITIANFKTITGGGDSSFCKLPGTRSLTDLRPINTCERGVNLQAIVPTDITGLNRASIPTIGAYEYLSTANNLSLEAILNPVISTTLGSQNLLIRIKNAGNNPVLGFNLNYKLNGSAIVSIPWTGTLASCDTISLNISGLNAMNILSGVNSLQVYISMPNGLPDSQNQNDTLGTEIRFYQALSGTYTIGGPNASFNTFADATIVLQNYGVSGPVTFMVNPGIYNEQVIVNGPIPGGSAANNIVFNGVNANNAMIRTAIADAAFKINLANYITVNNLSVTNNWYGTCAGIAIIGTPTASASVGCKIKNCIIQLPNVGRSASYGIHLTGHISSILEAPQWADSLVIDSNRVMFANSGIVITSGTTGNTLYNKGHLIRWNRVEQFYNYGIKVYYIFNPVVILNNYISTTVGLPHIGISVQYNRHLRAQATRINNNTIFSGTGIDLWNFSTGSPATEIYNNMIVGNGLLGSCGINVFNNGTVVTPINILHNSVNVTQSANNYGLNYYNFPGQAALIQNNIFKTTGPGSYPIYFATPVTAGNVDYNNYFNSSIFGNLGYRNSAAFTTANFNTAATGGTQSVSVIPSFVSSTDLHLTSACLRGTPVSQYLTTDIEGTLRYVFPVIGAHEAIGYSNDIGVENYSFNGPIVQGSNSLNLFIRNHTTGPIYNFSVKVSVNSGPWLIYSTSGYAIGCDSGTFTVPGALVLSNGFNSVRVVVFNPNGSPDNFAANDSLMFNISTLTTAPGNAFNGNGTSNYIKVPHQTSLTFGSNLSIEAWVNITDPSRDQVLISKTKTYGTDKGFIIGLVGGKIVSQIWDNTGLVYTQGALSNFPVGKWTHIAVTWAPGTDNFVTYVNGLVVILSNASLNPIGNNTSDLAIGAPSYNYTTQLVNGWIDEVRIWNIALNQNSIRKNMHRMMPASTPGLLVYFQMNEPLGNNIVFDCFSSLTGQISGTSNRVKSSVPAGGDSCLINSTITNGTYSLKNLNVNITSSFGASVDLVLNEIPYTPNVLPTGVQRTYTGNYWIVNPIGPSVTCTANLSFTLLPGQLSASDTTLRLFGRNAIEHGPWQLLKTVSTGGVVGNTVTFTGITNMGQFTIATNGASTLPVTLLKFNAARADNKVLLNWITTGNSVSKWFDIERNSGTGDFETIGRVNCMLGAGNYKYDFVDLFPIKGASFYRLRMTDLDGTISYSRTISINNENLESELRVYPNPFTDKLTLESKESGFIRYEILDIYGRVMNNGSLEANSIMDVVFDQKFKPGIYFLRLNDGDARMIVKE